ncbi:MAG TPA: class I SAM-dependent methyltransferase [Methylophilaceae bacterium]|nr:class I SAM-dependent methyltransferase [Methylophilaceae bacterium]
MASQISAKVRETPDIETSSDRYASRFSGKVGRYLLAVQEAGLISLLGLWPVSGNHVLDVGGGHAQLCAPLLKQGYLVSIIGSDQSCAQRARMLYGNAVAFYEGDLQQLPFADFQFDIVTSVRLISHIEGRETLVSELCRVAKKTVIIDYPTYASLNILSLITFPLKKLIEKNTRTYHTFWDRDISRMFNERGFVVTAEYRQFTLPMALHRLFANTVFVRAVEEILRKIGVTKFMGNPVLLRLDRSDQ